MKKYNLRWADRWPDIIFDLLSDNWAEKIDKKDGVYTIGSNDNTNFVYPWGVSPVFYIGKSADLVRRLRKHRMYIQQARDDHNKKLFRPKNQYGASFGADVAVYFSENKDVLNNFESNMITAFYKTYGSIPVANGVWPKAIQPEDKD